MDSGRCPKCGYIFDQAMDLDDSGSKPKEGDISFCINCGAVGMFDGVGVVSVDESLLDNVTRNEISKIRRAWKKM